MQSRPPRPLPLQTWTWATMQHTRCGSDYYRPRQRMPMQTRARLSFAVIHCYRHNYRTIIYNTPQPTATAIAWPGSPEVYGGGGRGGPSRPWPAKSTLSDRALSCYRTRVLRMDGHNHDQLAGDACHSCDDELQDLEKDLDSMKEHLLDHHSTDREVSERLLNKMTDSSFRESQLRRPVRCPAIFTLSCLFWELQGHYRRPSPLTTVSC